ncbi:MAG: hypothetical protein NTZ39_04875 [Methanoregula sp.]|nr:hypothetical protein [Methanoregula sp.]
MQNARIDPYIKEVINFSNFKFDFELRQYLSRAPVETKGYKRVINLPDQGTIHKNVLISETRCVWGLIFDQDHCPTFAAHQHYVSVVYGERGEVYV